MPGSSWIGEESVAVHEGLDLPRAPCTQRLKAEPVHTSLLTVGGPKTFHELAAGHEVPKTHSSFLFIDPNRSMATMHGPFDSISRELPKIDDMEPLKPFRNQKVFGGIKYPGGDVMGQSRYKAFNTWKKFWPKEDVYYQGARLGEYNRPNVFAPNAIGPLASAPVPIDKSEDELRLIWQSGSAAARARHAAWYSQKMTAEARRFFALAQKKVKDVVNVELPVTVVPGADVFPLYSASAPSLGIFLREPKERVAEKSINQQFL